MQLAAVTKSDRAAEVAPAVRPAADWRVVSVKVVPAARLRVCFVDGTEGEVEMQGFVKRTDVAGSVFEPLRDPESSAGIGGRWRCDMAERRGPGTGCDVRRDSRARSVGSGVSAAHLHPAE
jgi:hypothetical protein